MLSLLEYNVTLFRSHNETIHAGSHCITVCQFTSQLLPEITATAPTQRAVAELTRTQSFIVRLFTVGDRMQKKTFNHLGHFRDVLPSQSLGIVQKKLNLRQQNHTYTNKLQHKIIPKSYI